MESYGIRETASGSFTPERGKGGELEPRGPKDPRAMSQQEKERLPATIQELNDRFGEAKLDERFAARTAGLFDAPALERWWLAHPRAANVPNWDLIATCQVRGIRGLVLLEAKAHHGEVHLAGKIEPARASKSTPRMYFRPRPSANGSRSERAGFAVVPAALPVPEDRRPWPRTFPKVR